MQIRINPVTGELDLIGTPGGGGTVTSIAGGEGLTGTPDPIVGAGTLDLDIFSLTTESGIATGDWLPFVDVSVGTTPAAQRKATVANLVTLLNTGLITHSALGGLTTGDAGHTQFLLLAGRAGTTNDATISSSGVIGTIYGTAIATGALGLRGSSFAAVSESEMVLALSKVRCAPVFGATQIGAGDFAFFDAGGTSSYELAELATVQALIMQTGLNLDAGTTTGIRAMRVVHFRSSITSDAGATTDLGPFRGFNLVHDYTPGAGATMSNLNLAGVSQAAVLTNSGTGNTAARMAAARVGGTIGASWTVTDFQLGHLSIPGGGGAVTRFGGLELDDPSAFAGTIGAAYSVWAKGAYFLAHQGAAVFGAAQATLTAPTAGAIIDAFGNVLINNTGTAGELRLREPSAGGSSYTGFVAPALSGNIIYTLPSADAAGGLVSNGSGSLSWDVDLGEIAALANVRGDILVTNSTPAWARLPIGSADRYLKSDGSDPSWAQVTELGLVDTYNGATTVGRGMPSLVAEVNSTGQTADIASTSMHTTTATGWYRLSLSVVCTTDGGAGDTLPGSSMSYTDGTDSAVKSIIVTLSAANPNTTGLTSARTGQVVFYALTGTNVNYATSGYVGGTGMQYALRVRLEAL